MRRTITDTYEGPATLRTEGGAEVAVRLALRCDQEQIQAGDEWLDGMVSWEGDFRADGYPDLVGMVTLVLDDGRVGSALVSHASTKPAGGGVVTTGRVLGSGPWPS